jgi:hypothetical protein
MRDEIVERDARVILFAARVVVRAGRLADAAEVDAQADESRVV